MAERSVLREAETLLSDKVVALPRRGTASHYARLARWVALTDVLALEAALVAVWFIRAGPRPVMGSLYVLSILGPPVWLATFMAFRLYELSRLSPAEEFRRVFEAVAVGTALVGITSRLGAMLASPEARGVLSVEWGAWTMLISGVLILISRRIWHKYMWRLRRSGRLAYRTVIVGDNREARRISHSLHHRSTGYLPIGMIHTNGKEFGTGGVPTSAGGDELPILGRVEDLPRILGLAEIECVFIASSGVEPEVMSDLMDRLRRHDVEVRVSANISETMTTRLMLQQVGGLVALSLKPVRLTGPQAVTKRTLDVALASLAFIVALPVCAVVALAIKLDSRGPILYRQQRIGRHGQPFSILKFRTMVVGADAMLDQLQTRNEATGPLFKLRDDPRATRVGRWLRKWSLDELPQLLNVLKGEMSIVGPRPPLPGEVARYEDWHQVRLEIPPGITGLWQVSGRSQLTFDECVRLDLFYIQNWSIAYDLYIIGKTIPAVLLRKGAF